mmetsp:Transcript_11505/g.37831  ORF Transcript_11505/g.37831 Transcript_11505/m.37831 type:complete len:281 (+) Transcript_11505:26-868(+)
MVIRARDSWLPSTLRPFDVPAGEAEAAWMPGEDSTPFPTFFERGGRVDAAEAGQPLISLAPDPPEPRYHYKRPIDDSKRGLAELRPCLECCVCSSMCHTDASRRERERVMKQQRKDRVLNPVRLKNQTRTIESFAWDDGTTRDFTKEWVSVYITLDEAEGVAKEHCQITFTERSLVVTVGPLGPDSTTWKLRIARLQHPIDDEASWWKLNAEARRLTLKLKKADINQVWRGLPDGPHSVAKLNSAVNLQKRMQNEFDDDIIRLDAPGKWPGKPQYNMYGD